MYGANHSVFFVWLINNAIISNRAKHIVHEQQVRRFNRNTSSSIQLT